MPFTNWADYRTRLNAPNQVVRIAKSSVTAVAGRSDSMWQTAPFAGTAPGAAAVPTNATTGSLGQFNPTSLARFLTRLRYSNAASRGTLVLIDRLSHQSGLSGTVTTAQTTNLPTAALTRYTDGVGVMGAYEVYTAVGTTATTISCSYTNQAGTAGRTSQLTDFGTTTHGGAADRFIPISLASGDYGIRSVESVTVTASTTTAGNFGVTLYRPILALPLLGVESMDVDAVVELGCMMPEIIEDACLAWVFFGESTAPGIISVALSFSDV